MLRLHLLQSHLLVHRFLQQYRLRYYLYYQLHADQQLPLHLRQYPHYLYQYHQFHQLFQHHSLQQHSLYLLLFLLLHRLNL